MYSTQLAKTRTNEMNESIAILNHLPDQTGLKALRSIKLILHLISDCYIKVFISYAHKDDELRQELIPHLSSAQKEGLIELWHDREIRAGADWANEIDEKLEQADIILFLVSADFINSRYCSGIEMARAIERHQAKTACAIPIIIRFSDWTSTRLGELQAVPRDNKPVTSWGNDLNNPIERDEPWLLIVKEISQVAKEIRDKRKAELTVSQKAEARQSFRVKAQEYYQEGIFSPIETALLNLARQNLGLGETEAEAILDEVKAAYQQSQSNLEEYRRVLVAELADQESLSDAQQESLRQLQIALRINDLEAQAVEEKVLLERHQLQQNLQGFRHELQRVVNAEYPLSNEAKSGLDNFQQSLKLTSIDVSPLKKDIFALAEAAYQEKRRKERSFDFEVITVDEKGEEKSRITKTAAFFAEDLGDQVILEMVCIPSGNFQMGSPVGQGSDDERPQHVVTLPDFLIGKYPVTQAQWRAVAALPQVKIFLSSEPSHFKGGNLPVEKVSWYKAVEFCQRLSRHTGHSYRLPSEAEWEYACRAGTTTPFHFGDTISSAIVNYYAQDCESNGIVYSGKYGDGKLGECQSKTTIVGSFKVANNFGLYDMHGNVWEWCEDRFHDCYKNAPANGSSWIFNNNFERCLQGGSYDRVVRGGSWDNFPTDCRAASRGPRGQSDGSNTIGFRLVCEAFSGLL